MPHFAKTYTCFAAIVVQSAHLTVELKLDTVNVPVCNYLSPVQGLRPPRPTAGPQELSAAWWLQIRKHKVQKQMLDLTPHRSNVLLFALHFCSTWLQSIRGVWPPLSVIWWTEQHTPTEEMLKSIPSALITGRICTANSPCKEDSAVMAKCIPLSEQISSQFNRQHTDRTSCSRQTNLSLTGGLLSSVPPRWMDNFHEDNMKCDATECILNVMQLDALCSRKRSTRLKIITIIILISIGIFCSIQYF